MTVEVCKGICSEVAGKCVCVCVYARAEREDRGERGRRERDMQRMRWPYFFLL